MDDLPATETERLKNKCYAKFPFLVTKETYKELGLENQRNLPINEPDDSVKQKKRKVPVGVRMIEPAEDSSKYRPPCTPATCCTRTPISATGPQIHTKHQTIFPVMKSDNDPPSSTYRETIGKTGQDIFRAMKMYRLEKSKQANLKRK